MQMLSLPMFCKQGSKHNTKYNTCKSESVGEEYRKDIQYIRFVCSKLKEYMKRGLFVY